MNSKEEFLRKLLATFAVEAEDHIRQISDGLLTLEKEESEDTRAEVISVIYRAIHNFKGAARSVGMTSIEMICQSLEDVFSLLKNGRMEPTQAMFDTLYRAVDLISEIFSSPKSEHGDYFSILENLGKLRSVIQNKRSENYPGFDAQEEPTRYPENPQFHSSEIVQNVDHSTVDMRVSEQSIPTEQSTDHEVHGIIKSSQRQDLTFESKHYKEESVLIGSDRKKHGDEKQIHASHGSREDLAKSGRREKLDLGETIRVSTEKLNSLLLLTEELLSAKLAAAHQTADLKKLHRRIDAWARELDKIQPHIQTLQQQQTFKSSPEFDGVQSNLDTALDFIERNAQFTKSLKNEVTGLARYSTRQSYSLDSMVNELLAETKKILMLPFSNLLNFFPKLVRDLSRDQGKDIGISIRGGEIEVDRRILEEMKDPLIHVIRNCVDHGIEKPTLRGAKPPRGMIELEVNRVDGSHVEISIHDDGAGININKLKSAAVRLGIIQLQDVEKQSSENLIRLIFESDISTSPIVTDISGRGLGLAIVREKVENLGGSVSVASDAGEGTTFRILLPSTLATFRGILVEAGKHWFIFPTSFIESAIRFKRQEMKTVENRMTISLDGKAVPYSHLGEVLGIPVVSDDKADSFIALISGTGDQRIAFGIDQIGNEQEVLVKNLGKELNRVRNISAVTVLGSGRVVPILNVADLIKSAVRFSSASGVSIARPEEKGERTKSVLVVEDSITSRILLQNILETAGYSVITAQDGIDAFTRLKSEAFDLVVSDIEMPRMNGFELTTKIRGDAKLAEMPVILVTALDSREDKERGIEVGANAYIVKSSFDQGNLLNAIERMI